VKIFAGCASKLLTIQRRPLTVHCFCWAPNSKKSSPFQLKKVNFSELQPNSLAALSFCISAPQVQIGGKSAANQMDKTTLNNLCFTNLAGFVLISEVSAQRKVLNVMSPIPPPLAYNNWLLLGQQFVEKS